ncbi:hypothetical protein NC653_010814 [Populus alba x Populus x berolinensis]|uniref:Uncharacterized protein n=1 Tax=Populus alba x Populus x berolinensis TaxID=444605 RepID=A0AAD6W5Q3_9ROSI|nr:hypothetical protein NC653_010814 [Populus alba x Populus x berolinensis]
MELDQELYLICYMDGTTLAIRDAVSASVLSRSFMITEGSKLGVPVVWFTLCRGWNQHSPWSCNTVQGYKWNMSTRTATTQN